MAAPNGDATMDVDNDSDYAPSESNHSDESLKDASDGSDMEDVTTVSVQTQLRLAGHRRSNLFHSSRQANGSCANSHPSRQATSFWPGGSSCQRGYP
ncbi:hypothetical protein PRIC2_009468 [Phytophthora ramorum]